MANKIVKFFRYPIGFKLLLLRVLLESAKNELYLKSKFYKPIKHLHENQEETLDGEIPEDELPTLRQMSKAMKLLEKFAPWKPMCYNRALTAKNILAKKGIQTNLHIGFRKKDGEFDGHAWITYKGKFVTGLLPGIKSFKELEPIT